MSYDTGTTAMIMGQSLSSASYAVSFVLYIVQALSYYAMGRKAQVSYSWIAFIPILQILVVLAIIRRSVWNILWLLIPIVDIIFVIVWYVRLWKAFGQNPLWLLLLIVPGVNALYFLIMLCYMAFSSVRYDPTVL